MRISIIVAVAENGVIGNKGDLPWRLSSDLKRFRALTMGKPIIMGRKTFQSLPKPLDGRDNIVVTHSAQFAAPGAEVVSSLAQALDLARDHAARRQVDEIMVIGGGEIYAAVLSMADRVYLTRVHANPKGDTTFPPLDARVWAPVSEEPIPRGPKDEHAASLLIFDRQRPGN